MSLAGSEFTIMDFFCLLPYDFRLIFPLNQSKKLQFSTKNAKNQPQIPCLPSCVCSLWSAAFYLSSWVLCLESCGLNRFQSKTLTPKNKNKIFPNFLSPYNTSSYKISAPKKAQIFDSKLSTRLIIEAVFFYPQLSNFEFDSLGFWACLGFRY